MLTDGRGRNVAIFPFPQSVYWWYVAWVKWGDYNAAGAGKWKRSMFLKNLMRFAGAVAAALALVVRYRNPGLITSYVNVGLNLARSHVRIFSSISYFGVIMTDHPAAQSTKLLASFA